MRKKSKKVYGVGINDADYSVNVKDLSTGKVGTCRYYKRWMNMLERCYSEKALERNPTYLNTTVCSSWLTFSSFKGWMETQDWIDKELDKDLKGDGTIYSPESCAFISKRLNLMIAIGKRRDLSTGVSMSNCGRKYMASCHAFKEVGYQKNLGSFDTEAEAHSAWKTEKFKQALVMARQVDDVGVAIALISKYSGVSKAELDKMIIG